MAVTSNVVRRVKKPRATTGRNVSVKAQGIPLGQIKRNDTSRQLEISNRVAAVLGGAGANKQVNYLETPYNLSQLQSIYENSSILRQCIECYVNNIARTGYMVVPVSKSVDMDPGEEDILLSFVENANFDQSLITVQELTIFDHEEFGYCSREVIRNAAGQISLLRHIPSNMVRMTQKLDPTVRVQKQIFRGAQLHTIVENKKFRKFVQVVAGKKVWYKEFGDPRTMDLRTGEYVPASRLAASHRATEILYDKQFSNHVYGIPRWIHQLPNHLGLRESEEVNMRFFEENTIPPAILFVSGGRITQASYDNLQDILMGQRLGKDVQHKIILLEAIAATTGLEDKPQNIKLELEKLTDARQNDAVFKQYMEGAQRNIRVAFRLPPSLLGMSEDMNYAAANVSIFVAETQVFAPERRKHDEFLNMNVVNHPQGLNLKTVKLKSVGPSITDPKQGVSALTAMNVMGAVTPRQALQEANERFGFDLQPYPEKGEEGYEEWMDVPIGLTMRAARTQQTDEGEATQDEGSLKDRDVEDDEDGGGKDEQKPGRSE